MALKKFARGDVILPAVVFLLTFVVALFSLRLLSLDQEKDERLRAVYAAESTISRVSSQLNRYLAESDFFKKYIESGHVLREEEFAVISSNMQDGSSVIKTHELAKDGIVSQVYPVAGNEAAIGLDVLHNPARKKEANLAKNSGMYTIAGPFELVQGGTGALLFDPIYTYSKKGERSFWGFSILVLQWDNFIEEVELDKMEEAGYRYQIWKKDPYTGEKIVIAESEEDFPGNALEVACSVPNDTWYFEIIPKAGWFSDQQLLLGIVIATIIGMMAAYACWELMNRHQKDLQHEAALEKSAQEARAANEAKTRFLFNMSHDIRTPMNAIIGFSELLEKHIDEKDKVLDYTEKIRSSSAFLLSLINYVLEMARIESGKAVLKEESGDLCALMQTLSDVFEPSVQQKKLTCTYHTDVEHPYIVSDRTKVREILLNVISNAIKYTPEGGHIAVSVKELPAEKPKTGRYTFTVQDDGIGMSEEFQQHIFEPFFTTKKTGEGTGLGLALADQIIRTHRGRIRAESTIGRGTTFYVYLPVLEQQQEREQLQWGVDSKLRILAADDNNKVLDLLDKDLSALGLSVSTCSRRGELRQLLEQQPFDVLAIDESLMSSSGVDLCMAIRGRYPGMTRIVMTNAPTREIVDARSHGVIDGYVVKPVSASTLLAQIRSSRKE